MAGSVNKVLLVGNCVADPEIRRTQDGKMIANLRLATSESWRDKNTGESKKKAEFHRVVIFNEAIAKVVEQYVKKGMKVYVEGSLATRKWTDKDGVEKYSTEVVVQGFNGALTMLDSPKQSAAGEYEDERRADARQAAAVERGINPPGGNGPRAPSGKARAMDDEIPFAMEWR